MRSLALARELVAGGGSATLASADLDPSLEARATDAGVSVVRSEVPVGSAADQRWVAGLSSEGAFDWLMLDGYRFTDDYIAPLVDDVRVLLADDDGQCDEYRVHLVLNQNPSAHEGIYARRAAHTELLLGQDYALLRPEFLKRRGGERRLPETADRLLVTMGAADPVNATAFFLQACARLAGASLRVRVVVGPSNPNALESHDERIALLQPEAEGGMAELMAWADVAVSSAGSTMHELCLMGVPTATVLLAENQRSIAEPLAAAGAVLHLGWHHQLQLEPVCAALEALRADVERRRAMSARCRKRVDGRGAARVLARMEAR
jgi:UDP-2,4-diacetamido-2,4,6-trideoxy-beta-L-altropyranose hydrolase